MDASSLVEILVCTGVLTAFSEFVRARMNRSKTKVDSAKVVQGMALDMLKPLHDELERCNNELKGLRTRIKESDRALSAVIAWAIAARQILNTHRIAYPDVPSQLDTAPPSREPSQN